MYNNSLLSSFIKYVKPSTNPWKCINLLPNFRLYNLKKTSFLTTDMLLLLHQKFLGFLYSPDSAILYTLVKTDYCLCIYILCTLRVLIVSENWWQLFYFKLLLSVNDIPLFIYKNFLRSQVSKSRELETDSSDCYKGARWVP